MSAFLKDRICLGALSRLLEPVAQRAIDLQKTRVIMETGSL